jgi:transcriptional regulator with AAA-type ATPase domain/tetratricopeptide (TPR) repeat protein
MDPLAELVGESPVMEAVRDQIRRLLVRRETGRRLPSILISGETGTGKGLAARTIHRAGPRADGPFVDVNCAAIPETLLEAELFGFERGAFTDARRAKPGLFQAAHRGTIFLDEIGLLPEPLQAKLLKVLEEQAVRRLGATTAEPVDTWIISATNADLQAAVRQRVFREDLYHRLAVLILRLPPLRERGRDVLLLADRFLARSCADYGLPSKRLAPDATARLLEYPWPGNIRELNNVLERVALLSEDDVVTAGMLELEASPRVGLDATPAPPAPAMLSLDEAMRVHLLAALTQTDWNISRTAVLLNISRNTVRGRIERFGLKPGGGAAATPRAPTPRGRPVPRPVTVEAPALPAPSTLRWERRRITLLRASVVIPSGMEPLSVGSLALNALVEKVRTFGGRVEELSPMWLLASFGLEAVEDAARRAALAALAMQRVLDRAAKDDPLSPRLRIGIHVAEVRVGQGKGYAKIDSEEELGFRATIEALLASARPGDTVVSAAAAPFLERRFDLAAEPRTETQAPWYRLTGRERRGFELLGRIGTFVDRSRELELLETRLDSAVGGHGQVVALVGEPGVGKSRLVWEFTRSRGTGMGLVLEASGVAHGKAVPFLPIRDLLRAYFQIQETDGGDEIGAKVAGTIRGLDEELGFAIPALQALLEATVDDAAWRRLDPPQRRQRTFEALKLLLVRESRRRPVLLVLENLHWIDSETEGLLGLLVEAIPAARIMLLVTYRPEFRHGWGGASFYAQLGVEPLPSENAQELLDALLGGEPGLVPVKSRLVEWAGGNPFFMEESGRTLVETGVLVGERGAYRLAKTLEAVQIPSTVEEVLAARLARLPEEEKSLLDCAAVIGKHVPLSLLKSVTALGDAEVLERMRPLRAAELLYEAVSFPKVEYAFKHALTHDVAYRTITPERRRELHGRLVETLERTAAEDVQRLGYHAFRAERWPKAVTCLRQAGTKAAAQAANREAVACFEEVLRALDRLPLSSERTRLSIDVRIDLRHALTPLGLVQRTLEHLRAAEALAAELDDPARLGRVVSFIANCLILQGRYGEALVTGQRALDIAREHGDRPLQIATQMYIARARLNRGECEQANEMSHEIVRSLDERPLDDFLGLPVLPAAFARSTLATGLAEVGAFREAEAQAHEAARRAEASGRPHSLIWAYWGVGLVALMQGHAEEAVRVFDRMLVLCRTHDLDAYVSRFLAGLGWAKARSGQVAEGIVLMEQAVALDASAEPRTTHTLALTALAEGYLLAGDLEKALTTAGEAIRQARRHEERSAEAYASWVLATAQSAGASNLEAADDTFKAASAIASEQRLQPLLAHCHFGLGDLCERRGEQEAASEHRERGRRLCETLQMRPWIPIRTAG